MRAGLGALLGLAAVLLAAGPGAAQTGTRVLLQGAGATFPAPLYKKWISTYAAQHPDVAIDYKDVGSGEGVRRFLAAAVDFGASDSAMSDEQIARAPAGARLVPVTAGLVVLAYNLPGVGGDLRLARDVYADIFVGRIAKWNDPRIRVTNPGLALPNRSIVLAARQDGSGTTFALTNHLAAISPEWRDRGPGVGTVVNWSGRAMLARGNEGVAGLVKFGEGSLGYMEHAFARRLGLPTARLQNKAGHYVAPGDRGGQAALAANVKRMPANLRLFLPDPEGEESYPIVSFSWLLLHDRYPDPAKSAALKQFVTWSLGEGQRVGRDLGYIPLPDEVAALSRAAVERIP
jgi:phosphate transport system substrate-binding protein